MRRNLLLVAACPAHVYVHFPWCLKKCPYCDFASFERAQDAVDHRGYADAVIAELEHRRRAQAAWFDRPLDSVFFGGGTPSLWDPIELGRVLAAVLAAFGARPGEVEITAECNPSSLDAARAQALFAAGVNRFSIGVQGLDRDRLQFLGRLHDAPQALLAVKAALATGARVGADLIIGVATKSAAQTPEQAAAEVRAVADLGVGHVSAYQLTVEPRTRFGELHREGRLPLAGDDRLAECFLAASEALCGRGFEHYEISNFARQGQRSRHNLGYWRGRDYLGLGCAAWGTLSSPGGVAARYRNAPTPERYLSKAAAGDFTPHEAERLDPQTRLRERIMLGLRISDGFDLDAAAADLGVQAWPEGRRRAADELCAAGRLIRSGSVLRIPRDQWLFADGTAAALF